jgi:hypothetical protein
LVGAGQLVSESALGKADFNAENLAASVGMGAIIGGAFGGVLGAATAAVPLAKKAASPLTDYVSNFTNREHAALEILGYTPAKAAKLSEKNPQMVKDLPDFLTGELGLKAGDDAVTVLNKAERAQQKAGEGLGSTIKEYDNIIQVSPEYQVSSKGLYRDLAGEIEEKFIKSKSGSAESKAKMKEAGAYYEEIIKASFEDRPLNLSALQEARKGAYELGYSKVTGMPIDTLQGQMARHAGRFYSDRLKAVANEISTKSGTDNLFKQFIKDHRTYSLTSEVVPKLKSKALKGESLNPVVMSVLGGAAGAITGEGDFGNISIGALGGLAVRTFLKSDMRRNLVVLGQIEKANQKVARMTNAAVKNFVQPTAKAASRMVPFSIINSEFARKYENGKYKKPKTTAEAYANIHDNVQRYSQDPEAFTNRVNRSTAGMYEAAPNTSTAVDTLAVQAAMFLSKKLPKQTTAKGMLEMFNKQRPPSKLDLAKLERTLNALENPEVVYKEMENGKLSHEGAEVLRTVYPSLYAGLREKVLEQVGKNPKMPYNKKLQLGILLDIPTDESLIPENVLGLQATFGSNPESEQGMVNPTVSGTKELDMASRAATETQDNDELI